MVYNLVRRYGTFDDGGPYASETTRILVKLVDVEILQNCFIDKVGLLLHVFCLYHCSLDSQRIGSAFLHLLACLDIDVAACVEREMKSIAQDSRDEIERNYVFESLEDGTWILR
jgi:hypothetical protein